MNILLIMPLNEPFHVIVHAADTPWKSKLNSQTKIKKVDCVYPTGLLSIGTYLQKNLPEDCIRIIDCNVEINRMAEKLGSDGFDRAQFFEHCLNVCEAQTGTPDIVGISCLFCSNFFDLEAFSAAIHQRWKNALIVCGGHLPSAIYRRIFREPSSINAIGFGEGERPMLALCQAVKEKRQEEFLATSPNWITADKLRKQPDFQPASDAITDLDEIPPFKLEMLHAPEAYRVSSRYFFVIESCDELPEMLMFSTRGCPHHCVFCASQNVHGHKVRYYSTERIKSDILYYHRKYGIKRFVFYDDHFLINRKRAIEILDYVGSLGLRAEIPTPAFFAIDDDVAAAMHRAGIREVNITIESGNAETLRKIIGKPADLKRAEKAVEALHNQGISAISNILIGLPGETKESIDEGIRYLASTEVNWFQCFVTAPLPGSRMWDICEQNHYFTEADPYMIDFKKCVIRTPDFDPDYIEHKVYEMNLYLNFVHNRDFRIGNYEMALRLFDRILQTVLPTHAFAWYFAAKCCEKLNLEERYKECKAQYESMIARYSFWKEWAEFFKLESLK